MPIPSGLLISISGNTGKGAIAPPSGLLLVIMGLAASQSTLPVDFLEAVVAYLLADAATTAAFPGGISADQAAIGDELPYLVISEPQFDISYESTTDTPNSLEMLQLQVEIYATGKANARALRRQVSATLKDAEVTFAAGTNLYLRPSGGTTAEDPDLGPGGVTVWQEVVLFEALNGR